MAKKKENTLGFLGGILYAGQKTNLGFTQSLEGIADFAVGGLLKLFGADEAAEWIFENDWVDYEAPDKWYNPSKGWQVAGDVAGGIGTTIPALGATALVTAATGGTGTPAIVAAVAPTLAGSTAAGLSAAGTSTKEAYRESGQLTGKEFGYGALSGATEAGLELVTGAIGKGSGRLISTIAKSGSKTAAKTVAKSSAKYVIKELGKDFASEAFEEGFSTYISPIYKRMTYDPAAQNATWSEIGYSALVGGISGMIMGGSAGVMSLGDNLATGTAAVKDGSAQRIMQTAERFVNYENTNKTGFAALGDVQSAYNSLTESLKDTGGQITTVKQRMLLGELSSSLTAAAFTPLVEKSAMNILSDPEGVAARFSELGMTDENGKPLSFTAEDILEGIDRELLTKEKLTPAEQQRLTDSIRTALSSNAALATLAAADATGHIMLDTRKFSEAMLNGRALASKTDLNYFVEHATAEEKAALGAALGIEDWNSVDSTTLNEKVARFAAKGGITELAGNIKRVRAEKQAARANGAPIVESVSNSIVEETTLKNLLSKDDFEEYMRTGRKKHTRDKKQRMLESGKNPILTSKLETKQFIHDAIHGNALGEVRAFGRVDHKLANAIKEKRATLDVYGKFVELNADDLRESYKQHHYPKEPGDIEMSDTDFENVVDDIYNFDYVTAVNTHNNKTEVHIAKESENGYIRIITVVSNERNALQISKIFGVTKNKFEKKYGKKIERVIDNQRGQSKKSDVSNAATLPLFSNTLSTDIIPQKSEKGNTSEEKIFSVKETDGYARENIKDYHKLSAPNQAMIRALIRSGRAQGFSEANILTYARVSARSGVNIVFSKQRAVVGRIKGTAKLLYSDGFYDHASGEIVINPEGERSTGALLIHELAHAIYKDRQGRIIAERGVKNMTDAQKRAITKRYARIGKGDSISLIGEFNAHYAEGLLGNKNTLERLLADKPTLKDKILDFFKGAETDYSGDERLSREAEKLFKRYKKLFDSFSEKNQGNNATERGSGDRAYAFIGRTEDGRGIYRSNYPENTPKDVKQKDIIDLVQNVWSKKPIKLNLIVDNKTVSIEARFNPELTERSDLSKIAFGNRKGTASEKRITMNLSSDLYQIAEESRHVGSKTETGKDNAAHAGVTTWHYFITNLVYVEADGTKIDCYMNIDVKQNDSGNWFYSFAIEKGSRPADVLSVVTDESATTSTNSITKNSENVNSNSKKDFAIPENFEGEITKSIREDILNGREDLAESKKKNVETPKKKSTAQRAKSNANVNRKKVYTRKDARDVISGIVTERMSIDGKYYGKLSGASRDAATQILWTEMNRTAPGQRGKSALEIADYILQNSTLEHIEKISGAEEMIERRAVLKNYIHSFDLSSLKSEIKHKYDKKSGEIYLLWSRREGGVSPDSIVSELAEQGIQISSENSADILFEIHEAYKSAGEYLRREAKIYLDEALGKDEYEHMRQELAKEILRGYDTTGEASELAKVTNEYEKKIRTLKKNLEDVDTLNTVKNKALDIMNRIGDITKGNFANASSYNDEIFKGSIGKLANLKYRGNLRKSDVMRSALGDLGQWYSSTENKLFHDNEGKPTNLYRSDVADMMSFIAGREGELNATEFKMLTQILEYFKTTAENFNKIFRKGKWIDALPVAKGYIDIIEANKRVKVSFLRMLGGTTYAENFMEPMTVARRIDMYENGFFTEMTEELRTGAKNAQVAEMETLAKYNEFLGKNRNYIETATREAVEWRGVKISKMQLMQLYMTTKRRQAWTHLAYGGEKYLLDNKTAERLDGSVPMDTKLTLEELKAKMDTARNDIEAFLTDTDREYIRIVEGVYNGTCKEMKAKRDMERLGFTNALSDYYVPIRTADRATSVDTSSFYTEMDRASNSSFNHDTVKGAKNKLLIESADVVFRRHVRAVCQYAHLSAPIENFDRLFNLDISGNANAPYSIAVASENTWERGKQYFEKLVSDIQGISKNTEGMATLGWLRGGYAKYQLGANPKVWVTQLSSIFASSSILDADCISRGMFIGAEGIDEYSPLAKLRNNDNTAAMAQGLLDRNTKPRRFAKGAGRLGDVLMKPIGWMDRFVVRRIYGACQVQVEKNGGAKVGTVENKRAAGELLEKVILETQQNSLATERSKAMRSDNEFMRTITMFSSDSMKAIGRVIDGVGEVSVLKERIKAATESKVKSELEARLKTANRKARKAIFALMMSAAFMAGVAELFRWLYDKETDEDETAAERYRVNFIGNLLGGLPIARDIYSYFNDGFGMENYAYSMINDLIDSAKAITDTAGAILSGEATSRDIASNLRKMTYAAGQMFGVPTRNIYNTLYGLTKRFSPETAYKIDNVFYEKNYKNDLQRAIEADDTEMIGMLMSMLWGERMGDTLGETVYNELYALSQKGYKVMPRAVSSSITVDGEEIELSEEQQKSVRAAYSASQGQLERLFVKAGYQTLYEEQKTEAINYIYDMCYNIALADTMGVDSGKNALMSKIIGMDNLALLYVTTKGLTSDADGEGKSLVGSKRKKVIAAIGALGISTEQKLLLICAKGYALRDGDVRGLTAEGAKNRLLRYILSLRGLSAAEKTELAEMCGFKVKNGRIIRS